MATWSLREVPVALESNEEGGNHETTDVNLNFLLCPSGFQSSSFMPEKKDLPRDN
jgi:hypothetical protein